MKRTLIIDMSKNEGKEVFIKGWVHTRRDRGKLIFLDVRDRSALLQAVVNPQVSQVAYDAAKNLKPQYAIEAKGMVKKRPEGAVNKELPTGTIELEVSSLVVLSCASEFPFDMGGKSLNLQLPTLLDFRSLTLRHDAIRPIFKVQEALMEGFRRAAQKLGCTEVFVPTISASSTEGGAEVFRFPYYEQEAFLIQSPQLYKQIMVPVFERVYVVSHAYRAEPSVTTRHLSESIQLDCEFGFVDFEQLLDLLEIIGVAMLKTVEEKCSEILKNYGVEKIAFGKIP